MSGDINTELLFADIAKYGSLLDELHGESRSALTEDIEKLGKTRRAAAMVASIIESYYTCAETMFFRISQYFENSLSDNRWHKDLLERMTLEVAGFRPRVLSTAVYADLFELLQFRHFKRYYFSLAYEWDKMDEIVKRAERVHIPLKQNLEDFVTFLIRLRGPEEEA